MNRGYLALLSLLVLGYCQTRPTAHHDDTATELDEAALLTAKKVCADSLHMYAPNVQDLGSARALVYLRKAGTPFKLATCLTQFGKIQHITVTLRHQHPGTRP